MQFLTRMTSKTDRDELRKKFNDSVSLAKEYHVNFVEIKKVKLDGKCCWDNGTIGFDPKVEVGSLYHEVFHSAFHLSELNKGANGAWGEAFCEAFRYFAESQVGPKGKWHDKLTRYCSKSFKGVMDISHDRKYDKKYAYPASLIISKVGLTEGEKRFRDLWDDLHQKAKNSSGHFSLDAYFMYCMSQGEPIRKKRET